MSTAELNPPGGPPSRELSEGEAHRLFHERSLTLVGLSGPEFIRRWDAGDLDPDDERVLEVAMLLPFGR